MPHLSTYHSQIYCDFREIEASAYRQIVRFYEKNEDAIKQLDFEEGFDLLVAYVNALFDIGAYYKHLIMVDVVIEISILKNIKKFNGGDVFYKMLFKKAASLYNTLEYDKADYILRELIKINPFDKDTVLFLKKCLRKKESRLIVKTRELSIFLFLLAALLISVEILFVRPFYKAHIGMVELSRTVIFGLGVVSLLIGVLFQRWAVEKEVNQFVADIRQQKI